MNGDELAAVIGAVGGLTGVASVLVNWRSGAKKMSVEQGNQRYVELKGLLEMAKQDATAAKLQVEEIAAKWEASERRESALKVDLARERTKHAQLLKRVGALEREVAMCRESGKPPDRRAAAKTTKKRKAQ